MKRKVQKEVSKLIKHFEIKCLVREFKDQCKVWHLISEYQNLSEDFIREFQDKLYWCYISQFQHLSENFIREFQNKVLWDQICGHQYLSEDFIREFQDKVHWGFISRHQILSEGFIREFHNRINWIAISIEQHLPEDLIRKFQNKVHWGFICMYQNLSEDFIKEFQDKMHWSSIFTYQNLSEDFIREFKHKMSYSQILINQRLSEDFRKEFGVLVPESNWLYKSTQFKRQKILATGLYQIEGDDIVAYKSIRNDNCSVYLRSYIYEVGKTYTSTCNCSIEDSNSFGLSAWTIEGAKRYYASGKIIKVKIPIEKLGCIVHNGNKLRCFEFTVVEEIEKDA